jgi:hypothetical protein
MREADANKKCADTLKRTFPRSLYYKHCDKMSGGRPDSTFTWNGHLVARVQDARG